MEKYKDNVLKGLAGVDALLTREINIGYVCYRLETRKASQSERFCDMFNKSIGLVVKHYELNLCGMVW